ncbi:TonB-dependent receptor [Bdellovibrio svalbardensis]|uniref:TonB-dependent receptor n=1 Tax=Bdellovibrio svalbardensis TaxID=2972972 RepID=A0ABT6DG05_9BACT|nr:TonB-dependent receptor [Bdellovibrio svalbardensis]MDG0815439.1 TonB-dependent receptor [Bdellovibrio svalbardensis]
MLRSYLLLMLIIPTLFLCCVLEAKETDNITGRYKRIEDSTEILDQEMNRRLKELEEEANSDGIPCDKPRDMRVLFHDLNGSRFFIGSMESWAEDNEKIAKRSMPAHDSVYEGVLENGWIFNRLKLASTIKVNGQLIGTDKLGHFIDQGFEFYTPYRQSGYRMSVALDGSLGSEKGYSGGGSTGAVSYADATANYHGIRFYHNLTEGQSPYFRCSQGKWKQVRAFSFSEYVDAGWDEGINCSGIPSKEGRAQFDKNIQKLEVEAQRAGKGERYKCPADPQACVEIQARYMSVDRYVVSPECRKAAATTTPVSKTGTGTGRKNTSGVK